MSNYTLRYQKMVDESLKLKVQRQLLIDLLTERLEERPNNHWCGTSEFSHITWNRKVREAIAKIEEAN